MPDVMMHALRQRFRFASHHKEFMLFAVVGGIGTVLNTAVLYALTTYASMYYLGAAAIATELAIISNFLGNHYFTFKHRKTATSLSRKFLVFQTVSMVSLVCTLAILWALTSSFGQKYLLIWNLIAIAGAFLLNFLLNRRFTWNEKSS